MITFYGSEDIKVVSFNKSSLGKHVNRPPPPLSSHLIRLGLLVLLVLPRWGLDQLGLRKLDSIERGTVAALDRYGYDYGEQPLEPQGIRMILLVCRAEAVKHSA